MFAGLLNKGFSGSLLLLTTVFLLLSGLHFFAPAAIEINQYPNLFLNYFGGFLHGKTGVVLINAALILLGAALINLIAIRQEVTDKQNYFPVFLYMLIGFTCANNRQVSPQLISNVFVLYSFFLLLGTYRHESALNRIFEAAFWLSASIYFTIATILCFPLFLIAIMILRPFYWREWAIAFIGFIVPYIIYECLAYLCNFNVGYAPEAIAYFFSQMKPPSISEYYLLQSATLVVLFLIAIAQNLLMGLGNTVKKQRSKTILLWFSALSVMSVFAAGANTSGITLSFALPLCIFIGDFLFSLKRIKITNTILVILLLGACVIFAGHYRLL